MLPLFSQVSRQQFIKQSFTSCINTRGGLQTIKPRVIIRDQRSSQIMLRPDEQTLAQLAVQVKEKKISPMRLSVARTKTSTSTILAPIKYIQISPSELPNEISSRVFQGKFMKFPVGVSGKDHYVHGQVKVQTRKPGEGPFSHVKKGDYDVRGLKYLYVINKEGVHIKREMSYAPSNRGIVCHPKIAPFAYLGGEVWFLPEKEGKTVHINLNSGRFPAQSDDDLQATAKVWLSLGYDKVYVTPRDQRYGEVTPLLFMKEAVSEAKSETKSETKSEAKPQSKHLEFA